MEQRDWDENWHERANSILTTYQQRRYGKNYRIAVYCHDDYCHFGYFGIASHETHALMHAREGKSCSICIPEAHQRISNVEPNYDAIINAKLIQHANHIHPGMLIQHYLRYHQIIIHYCNIYYSFSFANERVLLYFIVSVTLRLSLLVRIGCFHLTPMPVQDISNYANLET